MSLPPPRLEPQDVAPAGRRWPWLLAGAVLGASAVTVGVVLASGDDDPRTSPPVTEPAASKPTEPAPSTDAPTTTSTSTTTTTTLPPTTTTAPPNMNPTGVVGDTMLLNDGSLVRVNAVTPGAPPPPDVDVPPGTVHHLVEIEQCGAPAQSSVMSDARWDVVLADGTEAEPDLYSRFPSVDLPSGVCAIGALSLVLPAQAAIAALTYHPFGVEEVTITVDGAHAPGPPLVAPEPAVAHLALGATHVDYDGGRITVRAVGAASPEVVAVDVELCGGEFDLHIGDFLMVGVDRTVVDYPEPGTIPAEEAPPGQCVAGTILFTVPPGWAPAFVVYNLENVAWQVAP